MRTTRVLCSFLVFAIAVLTAACSRETPTAKAITKADLGDEWPLSVDSGFIECRNGSEIVFTSGANTYAVNGSANDTGRYADLSAIWADDPSVGGLKISIRGLLDVGQELC